MRKYLICIAAISVAGCMASGCESERQNANALKQACEGKYNKDIITSDHNDLGECFGANFNNL